MTYPFRPRSQGAFQVEWNLDLKSTGCAVTGDGFALTTVVGGDAGMRELLDSDVTPRLGQCLPPPSQGSPTATLVSRRFLQQSDFQQFN